MELLQDIDDDIKHQKDMADMVKEVWQLLEDFEAAIAYTQRLPRFRKPKARLPKASCMHSVHWSLSRTVGRAPRIAARTTTTAKTPHVSRPL